MIFDLINRVLNQWEGTAEELGHALEQATDRTPLSYLRPELRECFALLRQDATRRILACEGGAELLRLERDRKR